MQSFLQEIVRAAGRVLLQHAGRIGRTELKENQSNVVTAADLASEQCLVAQIRARYPQHGILAEESGYAPGSEPIVWVIDPLDGTSNFAAGLPWFGVLVAVLEHGTPRLAAAYLPAANALYLAEAGQGVHRDGARVSVTTEPDLTRVLCAFGMDAGSTPEQTRRAAARLAGLVNASRNVRATNSLLDFCYTADGRLGGYVNLASKIWDIAGAALMLWEAGGLLTDLEGEPIQFRLGDEPFDRDYAVVGASPILHRQILEAIR